MRKGKGVKADGSIMTFEEYKKIICNIDKNDFAALLNAGRKWEKIEEKTYNAKIAFIGSSSIQLVTSVTKAMLTKYDICADVYEGEYNGILMDTMDENSKLYEFAPDYIVMLPDYRDIIDLKPLILEDKDKIETKVNQTISNYLHIFESIHSKLVGCQILISNFVVPFYGSLGNLETNYLFSEKSFINMVNLELINRKPSYVNILDMDSLAGFIGKKDWFDESSYFLNKSGFNLAYIGYVADLIARQFEAFYGKAKKCLVLDLDNTLWGGVVGDLGYNGIMLDPNDAEGEAFLSFQKYILELKNRGIILAVCSKNDEANAKEPFIKNENMVLKLNDISAFIANWNDKATNMIVISKQLNIGIDSLVFFDDNPTERALIKEFLPEVKVIDVPDDPALYVRALDQAYAFEWNQITQEDVSRIKTYTDNIERNNLMASCVNYDEYLKKLQMKIKITDANVDTLPRFAQLTNKSNQFNLRTQRYSEAEISEMLESPSYKLLTVSLKDRFSNYGIIACVVLHFENDTCYVENWVMSCRVLKKKVENYTMYKIFEQAKQFGCDYIKAEYIRSQKNSMVADLYSSLGFEKLDSNETISSFVLKLADIKEYETNYYFEEA